MNFQIINSNIINVPADAVVLPANCELKEGPGCSEAIFKAAGKRKLAQECKKLAPCAVGSSVPTPAFDLDADYIIHTVVPRWIDGEHNEYDLLSAAYISALSAADLMECESIAIPLLASGHNGYDLELAFGIAKASIESFSGKTLKHVYIVIFGERIASIVSTEGYPVVTLPPKIQNDSSDAEKREQRFKRKELRDKGKHIAKEVVYSQMKKALDYLSDEENLEKIIQNGFKIAEFVININKQKNQGTLQDHKD